MPSWQRMSAEERFEAQHTPEPNSGCWLWTGTSTRKGYGTIRIDGRATMAHRFSYEFHKGPIPDGLQIDHLCRVTCCVNPDHLEAVTGRENILRGNGLSAQNARKTHCIYGHALAGQNLGIGHRGKKRFCRICKRAQWRKYYHTGRIKTGRSDQPASSK